MPNQTWRVTATTGFDDLKISDEQIPEVGDKDVLVRRKNIQTVI